jgi:8-oxo-dGTP pyrophosphatase MutT (NUDIX family)
MLVRDGLDELVRGGPEDLLTTVERAGPALQVLMLRRNPRSTFAGGAYVFPGGAVDPEDGSLVADAIAGRTDVEASAILGVDAGGLAYWAAAIRECFEEAGVLVAEREDGSVPDFGDGRVAERFAAYRADVVAGRLSFADLCRREGLRLPAGQVHYFAHWITPDGAPRRYDTRFFVAAAPPDQTPAHDAGETIADRWVRPADALALHREGRIDLIFPTIRTLQAIGRCATAGELLATAAAAAPELAGAPPLLPRLVADGRGVRILLPGDDGYEAAGAGAGPPGDRTTMDRALRDASLAANLADAGAEADPTP